MIGTPNVFSLVLFCNYFELKIEKENPVQRYHLSMELARTPQKERDDNKENGVDHVPKLG